ncbi:MAG: hypothetical protein LC114_08855 [Bryobacterales bacterium]|nr:hypothetical protein [Bryobacterales bacterium]
MSSPSLVGHAAGFALPLSSIAQLLHDLPPESQLMLRKLASVLSTPVDAPALFTVLVTAVQVVDAYGKTLSTPTDTFREIARMLEALKDECCRKPLISVVADDPLRRRLLKHSAWALLLEMSKVPTPENLLAAAGVELAYCLATTKVFPNGYATNLRRALGPALDFLQPAGDTKEGEPAWLPHFRKVSREARKLFEAGTLPPDDRQTCFTEVAINTLRGASLLPDVRHRQGILDHSHLSPAMFFASAEALRSAAVDGCDDSILAILAFLSGLPLRATYRIPLAGFEDDWVMELDVEAGVLRTDLDQVFTKSAQPRETSAHRPAARVIVKPLPLFVADALKVRLNENPDARCVADLLPKATCDGSRLAIADEKFGIEPSVARFIHSAAAIAIHRGNDRLAAAVLTNDFGIIPVSKLYYCHIDRREIWDAAGKLYEGLGWGVSTPYADGIAFGSRVAPTREAISDWHQWLGGELDRLKPGKNCRIESLLTFHNRFAEASAAIIVFCLASRDTARIRLTADALAANVESIQLFDKKVGHLPRPLPVPVNTLVAWQARLWRAHCRALEKRFEKKAIAPDSPIRQRLKAVVNTRRVEMFFRIDGKLRPQPISCHQLVHSWATKFGFDSDFGRHFWECELRSSGVKGTVIDLFLRHQVVGIEGHRSTSDRSLAACFDEIVAAQERVLAELCVRPLAGLAKY